MVYKDKDPTRHDFWYPLVLGLGTSGLLGPGHSSCLWVSIDEDLDISDLDPLKTVRWSADGVALGARPHRVYMYIHV